VIAVAVDDPRERRLPEAGWIELEDAETGARAVVNTADRGVRIALSQEYDRRRSERNRILAALGVDTVALDTAEDYGRPLRSAFARRARRLKR